MINIFVIYKLIYKCTKWLSKIFQWQDNPYDLLLSIIIFSQPSAYKFYVCESWCLLTCSFTVYSYLNKTFCHFWQKVQSSDIEMNFAQFARTDKKWGTNYSYLKYFLSTCYNLFNPQRVLPNIRLWIKFEVAYFYYCGPG